MSGTKPNPEPFCPWVSKRKGCFGPITYGPLASASPTGHPRVKWGGGRRKLVGGQMSRTKSTWVDSAYSGRLNCQLCVLPFHSWPMPLSPQPTGSSVTPEREIGKGPTSELRRRKAGVGEDIDKIRNNDRPGLTSLTRTAPSPQDLQDKIHATKGTDAWQKLSKCNIFLPFLRSRLGEAIVRAPSLLYKRRDRPHRRDKRSTIEALTPHRDLGTFPLSLVCNPLLQTIRCRQREPPKTRVGTFNPNQYNPYVHWAHHPGLKRACINLLASACSKHRH